MVVATDGRYLEAAEALEGVTAVLAERDLLGWVGARLGELADGPVAFEADHVTVAAYDSLAQDGIELVPDPGVVEEVCAP